MGYPGIADRMQKEITALAPSTMNQDYCSTREEILCMDWRFYSCFTLHLPTDVDHKARIRRSRSIHCTQEVLLNISTKSQNKARKRTKSRQDTKNFAVPTLIRYCCFVI